jgi:abelson tyrosine-protein kinase 1
MGSFSNVYRGTWRGRTVAIKVLIESTPQHLFQREISIWQRLKNRNVLPLFGASSATGDPPWFFVSPYYRNGTLAEYLKRLPNKSMVLGGGVDVLKMLCEIARGMEYLHKEGVMHGDLKVRRAECGGGVARVSRADLIVQASNVLVSDTLRCVICDFGQSEMKSEAYRLSGTPIPRTCFPFC